MGGAGMNSKHSQIHSQTQCGRFVVPLNHQTRDQALGNWILQFWSSFALAGTMQSRTLNEVCDHCNFQLFLIFSMRGHDRWTSELQTQVKYTHKHIGMHWRCPRTASRDPELENWILQHLTFLCLWQSLLRVKCVAADFLK